MKFISPTWDSIYSQSIALATKLRKSPDGPYDVIVGVSRGGLALTRIMSDLLDIQKVLITRCEYYSDVDKRRKRPVITQKIQGNIIGKRVLLLDDVADTGESLVEITRYLRSKKPKTLTLATLYIKPWSKIVPDYFVSRTSAWIIFPWELYEAVKSLTRQRGMDIISKTKIPEHFVEKIFKMDPSLAKA